MNKKTQTFLYTRYRSPTKGYVTKQKECLR